MFDGLIYKTLYKIEILKEKIKIWYKSLINKNDTE